jgi:hypothetical protein
VFAAYFQPSLTRKRTSILLTYFHRTQHNCYLRLQCHLCGISTSPWSLATTQHTLFHRHDILKSLLPSMLHSHCSVLLNTVLHVIDVRLFSDLIAVFVAAHQSCL